MRRLCAAFFMALIAFHAASIQAADGDLYMLLRLDQTYDNAADVRDVLQAGITSTPGFSANVASVDPADEATFFQIKKLLTNFETRTGPTGPIEISRFNSNSSDWTIELEDPNQSLREVQVTYTKPGTIGELTDSFVPAADSDAKLKVHSAGRYNLRLPEGATPKNYIAKVSDLDGNATEETGSWPGLVNYYMVQLTDIRGDERLLYAGLKAGRAGIKVEEVNSESVEIVIADFELAVPDDGFTIAGNRLNIRAPKPGGVGDIMRIWMKFPLTEEEAKTQARAFSGLGMSETSAKIRSESVVAYDPSALAVLNPGAAAPWYELPPVLRDANENPAVFGREFILEDIPGWREKALEMKSAWQLIVYEFDNGTQKFAVKTKHPISGDQLNVIDKEMKSWIYAVKSLKPAPADN